MNTKTSLRREGHRTFPVAKGIPELWLHRLAVRRYRLAVQRWQIAQVRLHPWGLAGEARS